MDGYMDRKLETYGQFGDIDKERPFNLSEETQGLTQGQTQQRYTETDTDKIPENPPSITPTKETTQSHHNIQTKGPLPNTKPSIPSITPTNHKKSWQYTPQSPANNQQTKLHKPRTPDHPQPQTAIEASQTTTRFLVC